MGLLDAFGSSSFWTEDVPNSAKGLLSFKPDTRNVLARVLMEYAKDTPNRVRENIATNFPDPNLLTPQGMKTPQGQQARNALADVLMGFAGTTTPIKAAGGLLGDLNQFRQVDMFGNGSRVKSIDELAAKYPNVKIDAFVTKDDLNLSRIVVPKEMRNQGLGTQVMNDLFEYADNIGKRITLTPSSDFGGNVKRLKEFYKDFGFVENKGKNKDFSTSETMYREPKPQAMIPQGQQARNALADVLMGSAGTTTPVRGLTKFEQAHQLAQRNAALPVEQGGLGLPPNNTAMDRAKALGFTDDVYHGTNADIKGFDLSKSGSANAEQFGAGIYTATNPQTASGYANPAKGGANVLPLKVRLNNPITPETEKRLTKSQIKNIVQKSPEIDDVLWNFGDIGYEGKAKVLSNAVDSFHQFQKNKLLNTLHPMSSDFFPNSPEQFNNALASILKKDGVKVEFGIDDALWNFGESGDKFLIPWQANQVRSRFAAFDPMRRNEADLLGNADPRLLGGIAGGGLLGSYFWPKE